LAEEAANFFGTLCQHFILSPSFRERIAQKKKQRAASISPPGLEIRSRHFVDV
jgi:hypothetical protein